MTVNGTHRSTADPVAGRTPEASGAAWALPPGVRGCLHVLVRVGYPLSILLAWYFEQPRVAGFLLLFFLWLQRWLGGGIVGTALRQLSLLDWAVVWMLSAMSAAVACTGSDTLLRFYPACVNAGLLLAFAATLRVGPSMIERFARTRHPDLDARGVRYTRGVTALWCVFFIVNGLFSVYTACAWSSRAWALYNSAFVYVLIGALLGLEMLVRPRHEGAR